MAKASKQAHDLWPYLLPMVQRALSGNGSGSSGSAGVGGAPTPHALQSAHHTGSISNSQGPQFLLTDGTRDLTGNLAVDSGITIDGVDISAHAADPNAHHDTATAGNTAISITGQAISLFLNATASGLEISSGLRIADSVAGNGLVIASKVLAVGAGDGIDANANDVAVDVTDIINTSYGIYEPTANDIGINVVGNTGLTFASGALTLGTPTAVTVNSTNSVTTTTHTHDVATSSDVGTTPAESILASTPSGGLTLANLDVRGNVDIVNGGDLTVGSNILFVDASLESIGVNRAPDPQFDMDVAGNFRAAYIVGKHAIQLEDALFIAHYDNKEPHGKNHYGELNGHMGQVPVVKGGVALVPGKFYGALSMGTANTNYVENPRFDVDLSSWVTTTGGGTIARSTEEFYIGQASAKIVYGTSQAQLRANDSINVNNGATVTISAWVYRKFGTGSVNLTLHNVTDTVNQVDAPATLFGEWELLQITYTNSLGAAKSFAPWIRVSSAETVYVSGVMMVRDYPVPYLDGAMGGYSSTGKPNGTGYAWNSTAHNSPSTRVDAELSYAAGSNISGLRGTIMFWFRVPWGDVASDVNARYFFFVGADALSLRKVTSGDQLRLTVNGVDSALTFTWNDWDTAWHHMAVTWDAPTNTSQLFIDGILEATGTAAQFTPGTIHVGKNNASTGAFDGYLDDFVITSRVQTAGRIRTIYESDAPVFAASSVFHFRATPKGLVWADEEGLWMRNTTGDEVLGAYGGEATKSWAGLTLSPADIVFGDSNRGAYLLWDDSAGTLVLGKTGTSTSNLYLDGGSVRLRANATERFSLSSAGVMEIKDSAGAAVFTFNASAGAEFTLPLTLGTNGGIFQGTGTFASPTTGLKLWNQSGRGRIGGYNSGTLQWHVATDGRLYAGGDKVMLSADGVDLVAKANASIESFPTAEAVMWATALGGSPIAGVSGQTVSSFDANALTLAATNDAANDVSIISMTALDYLGGASTSLEIYNYGGGNNFIFLVADETDISGLLIGDMAFFEQASTTAALPTLKLSQADLSEEFIEFVGTVAAGNPIDTAALGSYYGKVRVSVNGTFKYMALYNS